MRFTTLIIALLSIALFFNSTSAEEAEGEFDILFVNGTVVDGTGAKRFKADVGVTGRSIAAIGKLNRKKSKRVIDIQGKIISPGYIDLHTHCDAALLGTNRIAKGYLNGVYQGVTTVVIGQLPAARIRRAC